MGLPPIDPITKRPTRGLISNAVRCLVLAPSLGIFLACGNGANRGDDSVITSITVSPGAITLRGGSSQPFTGNLVAGKSANTAIIWSVMGGDTNGFITSDGNYTAPQIPGTYQVMARSYQDQTKTAHATVLVMENLSLGVAVDNSGNAYIADAHNNIIRKVTPAGVVTTLAGMAPMSGMTSVGSNDGTGDTARFNGPTGIASDAMGNLYVADSGNNTIRKITPSGVVTTLVGMPPMPGMTSAGSNDGTGDAARFNGPSGVASDSVGNLYVADTGNNTIRKVTPAGVVTTLAGMAPMPNMTSSGSNDGTGDAARFNRPSGIASDDAGNLYVADTDNNTIRKISAAGVVTTLAGMAPMPGMTSIGSTDGKGDSARFSSPGGVGLGTLGNLYVADTSNNTIRMVTPSGVVTTLAGMPPMPGMTSVGDSDGKGENARFNAPIGLAVRPTGEICIGDSGNASIRKVTSDGVVTTSVRLGGS